MTTAKNKLNIKDESQLVDILNKMPNDRERISLIFDTIEEYQTADDPNDICLRASAIGYLRGILFRMGLYDSK